MWELLSADDSWPIEPEGYVFLAVALEEYVNESYEPHLIDRLGRVPHIDWRKLDIAKQTATEGEAFERDQLWQRVESACIAIGVAAFSGRLTIARRAKRGGALEPVPAAHWGIDDFLPRFAAASYNPDDPFSPSAQPSHWLFVSEKEWRTFVDDALRGLGKDLKYSRGSSVKRPAMSGMNFLPTQDIARPIDIEEAVCLALYGRPSADLAIYVDNATNELHFISSFKDGREANIAQLISIVGRERLQDALSAAFLKAYVQNPANGSYYSVPRFYWQDRKLSGQEYGYLEHVDGASGLDAAMIGQPIVVASNDLPDWRALGDHIRDMISSRPSESHDVCDISDVRSLSEPETEPKPEIEEQTTVRRRVGPASLKEWFKNVRIPEFEGKSPPNWMSCWEAAKLHFAPHQVVKDVLQEARRETAPPDWLKPGKRKGPEM